MHQNQSNTERLTEEYKYFAQPSKQSGVNSLLPSQKKSIVQSFKSLRSNPSGSDHETPGSSRAISRNVISLSNVQKCIEIKESSQRKSPNTRNSMNVLLSSKPSEFEQIRTVDISTAFRKCLLFKTRDVAANDSLNLFAEGKHGSSTMGSHVGRAESKGHELSLLSGLVTSNN